MKRVLYQLFILSFLFLSGCGYIEQSCDQQNYESMSNERGKITLYSGGQIVGEYPDSKIIYSNTDAQAVYFRTSGGKEIYWQGDSKFELED